MGADGGICWVVVRQGRREEFLTLLRPFWQLTSYDDYHSEDHDQVNVMDLVPSKYSQGEVVEATYGTNQEFQGLIDLEDILREIADPDPFFYGLGQDATFQDALDDLATDPGYSAFSLTTLHSLLKDYYRYKVGDFSGILDMKIRDWARQVIDCIYPDSFGSWETWT